MLKYHDLKVEVVNQASDDIQNHISRTILGTPRGLIYRLVDTVNKLGDMGLVYFMTLRKSTRLLGTVGLVHRMAKNGSKSFSTYYIRYFSIFAPLRVKSYKERKKELKEAKKQGNIFKKNNLIKDKVIPFFDNMASLNDPSMSSGTKSISFAYIEKKNYRSMDFSSMMGYITTREFATLVFSRFYPKKNENVSVISPEEKSEVLEKLNEKYFDYTTFYTDNIFYKDQYFVHKEKGEIVAGVQANRVEWEILEFPGRNGALLMKMVPKLPLMSKLFQPGSFKFAAFEGIYYKPGHEKKLPGLFESACTMLGVNVGLSWMDTESSLYKDVIEAGNLGFLCKVMKSQPANVRVKFLDVPENEQKEFFEKPAYISVFDMT